MADNKKKRGKADRARVAGGQAYEVAYVARKFHVSAATVRNVIKRVGNSRKKIYAALQKKKGGKADRARVSGKQSYEVAYVARKFGVSAAAVRKVIKRVGNSRKKVYAALERM